MTYVTVLTIPGFEEASLPSTPENVKRQLLNFAVVGGGRESLSSKPLDLS